MDKYKKLKEIRDNIKKKTYRDSLVGDGDDLIKCMEYILTVTYKTGVPEEKELEEVHDILFRICSRIFSLSIYRLRKKYWNKKDNAAFTRSFNKLCDVKGKYWRLYQKTDEYKNC